MGLDEANQFLAQNGVQYLLLLMLGVSLHKLSKKGPLMENFSERHKSFGKLKMTECAT